MAAMSSSVNACVQLNSRSPLPLGCIGMFGDAEQVMADPEREVPHRRDRAEVGQNERHRRASSAS